MTFQQSGDTLWGTAATDFGQIDVTDGWISGNDLSFTININFNGQAISVVFAGAVKGDSASGQIDVPGVGIPPFPFTAVKATGDLSLAALSPYARPVIIARAPLQPLARSITGSRPATRL